MCVVVSINGVYVLLVVGIFFSVVRNFVVMKVVYLCVSGVDEFWNNIVIYVVL